MRNLCWTLGLLGACLLGATWVVAEDGSKKDEAKKADQKKADAGSARGFNVLTVDKVAEKLGADAALTPEQKTKLEAAREELKKKYIEVNGKEEVKAAEDEIKKADEAKRAAEKKRHDALGGFDQTEEYKKILTSILTEAQLAKLYPVKASRQDAKAAKKDEAKKDEPKKDEP